MDYVSVFCAVVATAIIGAFARWAYKEGRRDGDRAASAWIAQAVENDLADAIAQRHFANDHQLIEQPQAQFSGYLLGLQRAGTRALERRFHGE